ncbi:MAG: SUMF1/EgtB/PvdO family nonheme iron enzyme [Chromatiaceae bacterium]
MIIPGYTIIRELGAGGMATVYLARQDRLEREVALKVLNPVTTDIHHFAARFVKESRIVARLQHRQIVTIYDFGSYEGYQWFSMEHLPGGTLAERIKSGLDSDCTLEIIKGIAEALACAHRESIIHRDIKPQNILFRSDDTPVLTDFGIARVTSLDSDATRLTRMDMMIGSPSYMSPEQIMGQPLDQRSDLYSLGVVFYEALTGSAPFEASDVMALAMKHCTEPMPRLSGQLGRFQPILDRLLAKKPEDRFERAEQLVQALAELTTDRHTAIKDDAAATRIVTPGSYPPQVHAERPAGRSSRAMVIGSVLLIGIVAGALFLLSQRNNGRPPGPEILTGLPLAAPGRPPAASNYEQLAVLDFEQGDMGRSLALINLGLEATPNDARLLALKQRVQIHLNAQGLLERARVLAQQGDPEGALDLLDQALAQVPKEQPLAALRSKLKEQIRVVQQARAEQLLGQAQDLYDRGDYQGGLEQVDAGLGIIPTHPQLLVLKERIQTHAKAQELLDRAQVLERQGDRSGALGLVNQGLTQVPDEARLLALRAKLKEQIRVAQQARAEQLLARAQELYDRGDYQGSLEQVDAGLGIIPAHPQLLALKERIQTHSKAQELLARAQLLAGQGDSAGALGLVEEGLAQVPDEARLLSLRSELKEQIRAAQQARAEQLLAQAQELYDRGEYQGSREQVDAGLRIIPTHPQLLELRKSITSTVAVRSKLEPLLAEARKLQAKGALDDAIARVEEALKLDPDDASIKALRAALNADIAKRRQALASAFLEQGRAHLNKEEFTAGLEVVEAGLRRLPGDRTLLALRAELAQGLEQRRQVEALLARARKLQEAGKLDESLRVVDQVLARAPVHPDAIALRNALRGKIEEQRRVGGRVQDCRSRTPASERLDPVLDPEVAITCWQQLLETDPENADAKTALAGIAHLMPVWTDAALAAGRIPEAQRLLKQLASLAPDHAELPRIRDAIATAQRRNALLPEMVPVGGGCYRMGSPADEAEREADEHPHKVCLDAFKVARYEVSVRDFRRFINATGYRTDAERDAGGDIGCWSLGRNGDGKTTWGHQHGVDWQVPVHSRRAQEDEPVACVSWNDAHAYIEWLNEQTQEHFRLPTEAEWEYAARAGTDTARWWGNEAGPAACRNANVADEGHEWKEGFNCDDGYEWAAPIGRFAPNSLGLKDILGNVFEWTCSVYDADYRGAEARCAAPGSDAPRTLRGGSWYSGTKPVRSAYRDRAFPESRYSFLGFRLARD